MNGYTIAALIVIGLAVYGFVVLRLVQAKIRRRKDDDISGLHGAR